MLIVWKLAVLSWGAGFLLGACCVLGKWSVVLRNGNQKRKGQTNGVDDPLIDDGCAGGFTKVFVCVRDSLLCCFVLGRICLSLTLYRIESFFLQECLIVNRNVL